MPKSSPAYLSPLRALVERREELSEHGIVDVEDVLRRRLADLLQCRDGVGDHHRIGVRDHVAQLLQETLLLHQFLVDIKQLCHADRGGLNERHSNKTGTKTTHAINKGQRQS
jgi:hypothetical protein